ncbi:ankyrin repeat and SOCS box protein 13-like [Gigantopelta aegis]|uniref:ankyrin repeat and SOCS box protein 13-like n=1 Tax=Gigantopelta aegis TaxID=1735272 RepID=UPI001B888E2B|nr:ankyrin repeat and SOCS box protein 13-like [Gigantopelta aegis]XP_041368176.1 ankyrin repeat and SOCS box protein 13-like [Gigantopelta aegis]XP_041368177.1 ankyrin repeat and SOCS box protein 13-like [Gigantopelta aegis]
MVVIGSQQSHDPDVAQSEEDDELSLEQAVIDQNVDDLSQMMERAAVSGRSHHSVVNKALLLSPACARGGTDVIRFLLSRGADCNACTEIDGERVWSVLHLVVVRSDLPCLQVLLQCDNIDKDPTSRSGQTPLMIACSNAFLPGVQLLLDSGCDVDKVNPVTPSTAVHSAFGVGVPFRTICYSAFETFEQFQCFQCLVEGGADLESRDELGFAAIHYAVRINHIDAVKLLVSKNCDLNATGTFQPGTFDSGSIVEGVPVTPFLLAVHYGHSRIAKLLIDSGCDFYQSDHILKSLDDNTMLTWLKGEFKTPRKLRDMTRTYIRRLLGKTIRTSVDRLPIPVLQKQNLLLNDVLNDEVQMFPAVSSETTRL